MLATRIANRQFFCLRGQTFTIFRSKELVPNGLWTVCCINLPIDLSKGEPYIDDDAWVLNGFIVMLSYLCFKDMLESSLI